MGRERSGHGPRFLPLPRALGEPQSEQKQAGPAQLRHKPKVHTDPSVLSLPPRLGHSCCYFVTPFS